MDHLRHRSNLVNPACLLSFSKHCPSKAGYQAPAGCGENKTEKKPLLGVLRPVSSTGRAARKGTGKCTSDVDLTVVSNAFLFCDSQSGTELLRAAEFIPFLPEQPFGKALILQKRPPFYRKDDLTCLANTERAGWDWG